QFKTGCRLTFSSLVIVVFILAVQPAGGRQRNAATSRDAGLAVPDLNGIWQVLNTAAWDIQAHVGDLGVPPGEGVVEGGEIPHQVWAAEKQKELFAKRAAADPAARRFLPGVPRLTYMPFPFEIVQTPNYIAMIFEYAHATCRRSPIMLLRRSSM